MQPISRKDARAAGLKFYYTGRSCRRGYVARRLVSCAMCEDCQKAYNAVRLYRDKAADNARTRAWNLANRESRLLTYARRRAKKLGVPCTISKSDIRIPKLCPVFGVPLSRGLGTHGPKDWSPSLDRVKPELGYVPGNVAVISFLANRIKSNATAAELRAVAEWLDTFNLTK